MPSAAATFPNVTAFNARTFAARDHRRAIVGGAVLGLGSVTAVAMMAGTATVAAAWMVAGSLAGNPDFRASAPTALEMAAFPRPPRRLADPADLLGGALASANPAYARNLTREAELNSAMVPISPPSSAAQLPLRRSAGLTRAMPLPRQRPAELASNVPLPPQRLADVTGSVPRSPAHSLDVAEIQAKPEIARTAEIPTAPPATVEPGEVRLEAMLPRDSRATHEARTEPQAPAIIPPPPAATAKVLQKPAAPQLAYNNPDLPAGRDSHAAIYDIAAHTVYLPDGKRLEAHSGLGRMLDDPRYVAQKGRGATPPNVYDLTLRRQLFHGVQALRLNPVADSKMFGRAGILAHTYMLGPSGQSFGCVSFRDYPEFLHAFLRGEVDRLVVVPHLSAPPASVRAQRDDGNRYAFDIENAH